VRSTTPGLTEPGVLQLEPDGYGRGGGPRGPWWRSSAALSAAAAIVVLGIAGGAFALVHGGGGNRRPSGLATNIPVPAPGDTVASAKQLSVQEQTVILGGAPFGVVVTPDGKYSFVSTGDSVAVLKNGGSSGPTKVATIPAPGARKSLAITHNGQYLLAAEGGGAYLINVKNAEAGNGTGALVGTISSPGGLQSVELSISPDDRFAFITEQNSGDMAVFNLQKSMTGGFGQAGFVGFTPIGPSPVGIAQSPDGKWLYVVSQIPAGKLVVVNMHLAERNPMVAVTTSAAVGAGPARVIVSPDGNTIWVTDRDSNALVALSATKLLRTPSHSIIARVSVGQNPIGLAFVKDGTEIVVADADLLGILGENNLAVISTAKALAGLDHPALLGFIPAGTTPRELALEPGGKTLLSTDNSSGQLQAVVVGSLP
jgi:DNA-binding beta-propeller fold protein YncE